jgi:cytoskeletal protein RodZ
MSDFDKLSRLNKFEKRRKNTKYISVLLVTASVLLISLLGIWIFGGGNDDKAADSNNPSSDHAANQEENFVTITEDEDENSEETENTAGSESNGEGEEEEEESNSSDGEVEIEEAEPSDENVIEAYTGNWQPVGTEQEGPHTTDFTRNSQDWIEIHEAVFYATGLSEEDVTTHWVGNDGEQKVVATVSTSDHAEIYRVFLTFIEDEGWQPTKVEVLEEVDV